MFFGGLKYNPLPWSFSKILNSQNCGWAAATTIQGIYPHTALAQKPRETSDGLFLHKLMHWYLTTGELVYKLPDTAGSHDYLPSVYFENAIKFVTQEFPKIQESMGDTVKVYPEIKVSLTDDLQPSIVYQNSFITGIIDLLLINDDGDVIICDYKSEKRTDRINREATKKQLNIYALLVNYGMKPVKRYALAAYYLYTGDLEFYSGTKDNPFLDYEENESKILAQVSEDIESATKSLKAAVKTPGYYCKYCSFRLMCDEALLEEEHARS